MKHIRSTRQLTLNIETLRHLRGLVATELGQARGGAQGIADPSWSQYGGDDCPKTQPQG